MKASTPLLRIGLIADVQYADQDDMESPEHWRSYRHSLNKLRACIDDFNGEILDFIVNLGDTIDGGYENLAAPMVAFKKSKCLVYHALGNHDLMLDPQHISKVYAALGFESTPYYSFVRAGFRFVVLDINDISAHKPETAQRAQHMMNRVERRGKPYGKPWNGAMDDKQYAWLERELADAAHSNQKVIVFAHHPILPIDWHVPYDVERLQGVVDVSPHIVAYINGHNHQGDYVERNGVHYLTVAGMVDFKDQTAYAVANVYEDRIEIIGVGRQASLTMPFAK